MKIVRLPEPGGDPGKKFTPHQDPAPIHGSESINFVQFNTLLSAVNAYMAFIANARIESDDYKPGKAIDGGVMLAAEQTFVGICNRVDAMISDSSRWTMVQQQSLEASAKALYEEHRKLIQDQRAAVATMQSPHVRFHPQLIYIEEQKRWAAVFGDASSAATSIIGVGPSAEDALRDFDIKFTSNIYDQTKDQTKRVDETRGAVPNQQPRQTDPAADSRKTGAKPGRRARKEPTARRAK